MADATKFSSSTGRSRRVAVVGGGIAGCSAAWMLHGAGVEVTVFEARDQLGGNAKTWRWGVNGTSVVTGLSVLAWPEQYFRNYGRLVETLGIGSELVRLRFFIRHGDQVYAHDLDTPLSRAYADDLKRWERVVRFVTAVNQSFARSRTRSLYHVAPLNPMNYLRLRQLAGWFGVSAGFWEDVIVPLYSSSFLTVKLDTLPAVIVPALDEMISARSGGRMRTWSTSSADVFEALTADFRERVHTNTPITRVVSDADGVTVSTTAGAEERFDDLIWAADAISLGEARASPSRLQRRLFGAVQYGDDDDDAFLVGHVHGNADVLPVAHRRRILDDYCTYVDVKADATGERRYENHFVISSWLPSVQGRDAVMMVSYNRPEDQPIDGRETTISNRRAHPAFSFTNLAVAQLLRYLQGRDHLYYCGSWTTPGNGHDLSLLSGMIVACELGATYPFADDAAAQADFRRLRRLMLGSSRRGAQRRGPIRSAWRRLLALAGVSSPGADARGPAADGSATTGSPDPTSTGWPARSD